MVCVDLREIEIEFRPGQLEQAGDCRPIDRSSGERQLHPGELLLDHLLDDDLLRWLQVVAADAATDAEEFAKLILGMLRHPFHDLVDLAWSLVELAGRQRFDIEAFTTVERAVEDIARALFSRARSVPVKNPAGALSLDLLVDERKRYRDEPLKVGAVAKLVDPQRHQAGVTKLVDHLERHLIEWAP